MKQPKQPKPVANAASASSSPPAPTGSSSNVPVRNLMPSVLAHPSFGSVQLIDIGANLTDDMFDGHYHGKKLHQPDLDLVLQRAYERGVRKIIVTAGCAKESVKVQKLIAHLEAEASAKGMQFPLLYSTVGVHPTRSKEWEGNEKHQANYFDRLLHSIMDGLGMTVGAAAAAASASASSSAAAAPAVAHPSRQVVVSIGECGLDYDRLHYSDRETQLRHFAKHFALVERVVELTKTRQGGSVHLPLFLHDRNTRGEFLQIIKDNRSRFRDGVVHSFTGSIDDLKALLALDLHIGINGCSLKTDANLAALDHIPLNRLMLETDAPWCDIRASHSSSALVGTRFGEGELLQARVPEKWSASFKGGVKGRNEPANMVQVLEVVAARLGMDPVELAAIVWRNTQRVFFPHEFEAEEAAAAAAATASAASAATSAVENK